MSLGVKNCGKAGEVKEGNADINNRKTEVVAHFAYKWRPRLRAKKQGKKFFKSFKENPS